MSIGDALTALAIGGGAGMRDYADRRYQQEQDEAAQVDAARRARLQELAHALNEARARHEVDIDNRRLNVDRAQFAEQMKDRATDRSWRSGENALDRTARATEGQAERTERAGYERDRNETSLKAAKIRADAARRARIHSERLRRRDTGRREYTDYMKSYMAQMTKLYDPSSYELSPEARATAADRVNRIVRAEAARKAKEYGGNVRTNYDESGQEVHEIEWPDDDIDMATMDSEEEDITADEALEDESTPAPGDGTGSPAPSPDGSGAGSSKRKVSLKDRLNKKANDPLRRPF